MVKFHFLLSNAVEEVRNYPYLKIVNNGKKSLHRMLLKKLPSLKMVQNGKIPFLTTYLGIERR